VQVHCLKHYISPESFLCLADETVDDSVRFGKQITSFVEGVCVFVSTHVLIIYMLVLVFAYSDQLLRYFGLFLFRDENHEVLAMLFSRLIVQIFYSTKSKHTKSHIL
jgi:hypothetical protein